MEQTEQLLHPNFQRSPLQFVQIYWVFVKYYVGGGGMNEVCDFYGD